MTDVPLTGPALEIHRRLEAGQDLDRITAAGRWLGAWSREDVLAVEWYRQQRESERRAERVMAVAEELSPPTAWPDCGTPRAATRHRREHEWLDEPCRLARNEYQNRRRRKDGAA